MRQTIQTAPDLHQDEALSYRDGFATDENPLARTDALPTLDDEPASLDLADEPAPEAPQESTDEESTTAPDDSLGLYLRQMGAIPLLSREEEIRLAKRLEVARQRFRRAALWSWPILGRVIEMFDQVQSGQLAVDPTIDVVNSLGLSREQILARMPTNLRTLRQLQTGAAADFKVLLRTNAPTAKARLYRAHARRLRKAIKLAEELSPRIEVLERSVEQLRRQSAEMSELSRQIDTGGRSAAQREARTKRIKELRDMMLRLLTTPEHHDRLLHVLKHRASLFQRARRELAEGNLRLVVSIAKRYRGRGL